MITPTGTMPDATAGRHPAVTLPATRRRLADFAGLTKPRVVLMVGLTTWTGYYLGRPGEAASADAWRLVHTLAGTVLAAAGTLALNQFLERDLDARMRRTCDRPLPGGRLLPVDALVFGSLVVVAGLLYLGLAVGGPPMLVTAATAVLYLAVYTPLKRLSPFCLVVGAVPGALPPVTGWLAARGELGVGAAVLFGILFLWQVPHTLAIARLYQQDYTRAGIRMPPVLDPDGRSTEWQIVAGCLALQAVALLPSAIGLTGPAYLVGALALGGILLASGVAQAVAPSSGAARRLLLVSVVYLPALLGLMALDKVR